MTPLRLCWFTTGRGPGSFSLLRSTIEAIESGSLSARIELLFCNRGRGEAEPTDRLLAYAESHGIAVEARSSVAFRKGQGGERSRPGERIPEWRAGFDQSAMEILDGYEFDLGVLAGYMLITTPELCRRYPLLNLHPAAPGGPKGAWQDVTWELIKSGAGESGILIHVVTPELDEGPPVACCRYPIKTPQLAAEWQRLTGADVDDLRREEGESLPLFAAVRRMGLEREAPLLVATLEAAARRRFVVRPGVAEAGASGEPLPIDLTRRVEEALDSAEDLQPGADHE
ncbi:MAG: phosphoglycerate transporter [Dehalococcoidia bacterium]|nr:phosphoglycerate transporter [Dehalococcoidia bacterium]